MARAILSESTLFSQNQLSDPLKSLSEPFCRIVSETLLPKCLVIDRNFMDHLSDNEIIEYLYTNTVTQIDINPLKQENSWVYLKRFNRILTQNFPLVEALRLVAWDDLVNINISWVKHLNDIAGKKFCDVVIWHFKSLCRENLAQYGNPNYKTRIVKDDYRNITFVWNFSRTKEVFFWNLEKKEEVIASLLSSLATEIKKRAKEIIDEKINIWELTPKNDTQYKDYISEKIEKIKHAIQWHFNFWISQVSIPNTLSHINRLETLRKSEISSRAWIPKRNISVQDYNEDIIFKLLEQGWNIEKQIIKEYRGKKFEFDGTHYNIIFEQSGKINISSELLRYVRKYPKNITPTRLVKQVAKFMQIRNLALDYIPPIEDIENIFQDFNTATHINSEMAKWIIHTDYLFKTYKWGYTKEAFSHAIKNKKWVCISIDIKDMWIENIFDFDAIAKQILELKKQYKDGAIPKWYYEKKLKELFLSAWKTVTDNFREVQLRIRDKYKNGIIRFGGDEIELFLPNKEESDLENIKNYIHTCLNASGQKARIMTDITQGKENGEFSFAQLDRIGKINKIVEEIFEKQQQSYPKTSWEIPNCTFLKMDDYAKNIIFRPWFHLEEFIKMLRYSILETLKKDPKTLWQKTEIHIPSFAYGINLTLKRKENSQIDIYLHN